MEYSTEQIEKVMQECIGNDVLPITSLLHKNEELSELKLAKIMKVDVNEARRLLYKLHHHNLVTFKKKKDMESGWYTYYWRLNLNSMNVLINKVSQDSFAKISRLIEKESTNQFFRCDDNCVRLDHHTAMSYNFKCPECGQILGVEDNSQRIIMLKERLNEIVSIFEMDQNILKNNEN
jgi:transcription initiation factor TFIIE subunit alpha